MISEGNQAKYMRLKEYLKEEIVMGRIVPGEQIPSENALADRFSLSRHTVRKALSMLANEGYLHTEHGRGTYCLDKSTSRNSSKNIGVITTYISEYIFPSVIQGIDSVLSEQGYSIILKNTGNNIEKEAACLEDMLEKGVDGIIVEPTKSAVYTGNHKYYEALERLHIPFVFVHGCSRQFEDRPQVVLDDAQGMYSIVEYLFKTGHRNIAGIFKADDVQGLNRHMGFAGALADHGLPYNPRRVVWFYTEDKQVAPSAAVTGMVKSGVNIDAVVCYNDEIACRVYDALAGAGRNVPGEVSVTGFDDSYLALNCPVKLTTASHPKEKLGEAAADILLGLLGRRDPGQLKRVITPELVIRESCKSRL